MFDLAIFCSTLKWLKPANISQAPAKAKAKPSKALKDTNVLKPSIAVNSDQAIEDIYQKKTQLEHILLRPDTYIGSTEKQQQKMWIHDGTSIKLADIDYVPGLYKIFDEILVNAADNKVRDPKMDTLKVDINQVCFQIIFSKRVVYRLANHLHGIHSIDQFQKIGLSLLIL